MVGLKYYGFKNWVHVLEPKASLTWLQDINPLHKLNFLSHDCWRFFQKKWLGIQAKSKLRAVYIHLILPDELPQRSVLGEITWFGKWSLCMYWKHHAPTARGSEGFKRGVESIIIFLALFYVINRMLTDILNRALTSKSCLNIAYIFPRPHSSNLSASCWVTRMNFNCYRIFLSVRMPKRSLTLVSVASYSFL